MYCKMRCVCIQQESIIVSFHIQVDKEVDPTIVDEKCTLSNSVEMIREIQSKSTEAARAQLRTRHGIKEDRNPMLTLPADLFR